MRDKLISEIRPTLDLDTDNSSDIEAFQNTTLRPILKLQHTITSKLLHGSANFQKVIQKIDESNEKEFRKTVSQFVSTNAVFKNRLLGMIIGLMTEEEYDFYDMNSTELNKRIINMQIQRYFD